MQLIQQHIPDPVLQELVRQYVYYTVERAGEFHTPEYGISRGCALSPLIGGSLLWHIDHGFSSQKGVFYRRYMDDFLILTRTRWQLRRCVKQLHQYFAPGGFDVHPDKTQIGRPLAGFDWLGVQFGEPEPQIAVRALKNHNERCLRLYEQSRRMGLSERQTGVRVQAYRTRWDIWAAGVLSAAGARGELT